MFSAKSMAIMFGAVKQNDAGAVDMVTSGTVYKTVRKEDVYSGAEANERKVNINGIPVTLPAGASYYSDNGTALGTNPTEYAYVTFPLTTSDFKEITISSDNFPGTYYITGDTYARPLSGGVDEFFQFVIPKAKVQSEVTLTMEAEGDPSTFSMNLRVLRPANGEMMKLIKYSLPDPNATPAAQG